MFNFHFTTSILKFPNKGLGWFKYFIDVVLSRSENSSIFWGEKVRVLETKLIGCFVFSVASSLAGKNMQLKAKNGAIRE